MVDGMNVEFRVEHVACECHIGIVVELKEFFRHQWRRVADEAFADIEAPRKTAVGLHGRKRIVECALTLELHFVLPLGVEVDADGCARSDGDKSTEIEQHPRRSDRVGGSDDRGVVEIDKPDHVARGLTLYDILRVGHNIGDIRARVELQPGIDIEIIERAASRGVEVDESLAVGLRALRGACGVDYLHVARTEGEVEGHVGERFEFHFAVD